MYTTRFFCIDSNFVLVYSKSVLLLYSNRVDRLIKHRSYIILIWILFYCNKVQITIPFPGVERLIQHLYDNGVPIGLATSSSKETYDLKVKNHSELFNMLEYKTWGSSDPLVKKGKPYPDIFLVAADKFLDKPAPEKVMMQ